MATWAVALISGLIAIIIGALVGVFVGGAISKKKINKTIGDAKRIAEDANIEAEKIKSKALSEAKETVRQLKLEADEDIKNRKEVVIELENKLNSREDTLDRRSSNLDRREEILNDKEDRLDQKKEELAKAAALNEASLLNKAASQAAAISKKI